MALLLPVLIDRVTRRTHGTRGDPLTRDEVEQVVTATILELGKARERGELEPLDVRLPDVPGSAEGMSETTERPQPEQPEQPDVQPGEQQQDDEQERQRRERPGRQQPDDDDAEARAEPYDPQGF